MIFKTLTLQNFGPYANRQSLNLTTDASRPIILIGGMNGGGKTTLMDALRLVLYGQRAQCSNRGNLAYADFLSQCIHHAAAPDAETAVELVFEHSLSDEPVHYHLRRAWSLTAKETLTVYTAQSADQEELPDLALAKLWDERIEDLLPLGISNLFLFDGEQIKELAEQDKPPQAVINAIQSLLGLELPDRLSLDLKILRDRKQKAIADPHSLSELQTLETQIEQQTQAYQHALQDQGSLQNKVDRARNELNVATQLFNMRGGEITAQRAELEARQRGQAQTAENLQANLRQLAAGVLPLGQIQALLKRAQSQGQREVSVQQAQVADEQIQTHDQRLLKFAQQHCEPETVRQLQQFIDREEQTRQATIAQTQTYLGIDALTQQHLSHILKQQLPKVRREVNRKTQALELTAIEIDNAERQLAAAAPPEEYAQLAETMRNAVAKLARLESQQGAQSQQIQQLKQALENSKAELARYSNILLSRQNDEHILKSIKRVQQTIGQFRDRLKLRKVDQLESAVTECFRFLLQKTDFISRVTVDTETFNLTLHDTSGQTISKKRLSAGEKQILATAFLWGLARVSGRNLPVAIDTPLGRLDSSHRHNLIDRYFPTASHQVILLSTDTEIGAAEVKYLHQEAAIAHEYRLDYNPTHRQTKITPGYFTFTSAYGPPR
ncbi:MAG: DNA sulfur modification protein DndD [Cyanobacteria bacterium P01_G01_bin.54]